MNINEKILILGSLFHDIGKFKQRAEKTKQKSHSDFGVDFVNSLKETFKKILEDKDKEENFSKFLEIIKNHHSKEKNLDLFTQIIKIADHGNASEREDLQYVETENGKFKDFSHRFLASIFSKTKIHPDFQSELETKFFDQSKFEISKIIPKEKNNILQTHYFSFEELLKSLESISTFTNFEDIISFLLEVLKTYTWSIPDFTGNEKTDISLFTHSKDVSAISHCIYKWKLEDKERKIECTKFKIIVGDFLGIQKFITDIEGEKVAKRLRSRSTLVQIYGKIFSDVVLHEFGLTEANLLMQAGGKFYILVPDLKNFDNLIKNIKKKVEFFLKEKHFYELRFAIWNSRDFGLNAFSGKDDEENIFDIFESISENLQDERNNQFESLIKDENSWQDVFVGNFEFEKNIEDFENIKCPICKKPKKLSKTLQEENGEKKICENCFLEISLGEKMVRDEFEIFYSFDEKIEISFLKKENFRRLLINPDREKIFEKAKDGRKNENSEGEEIKKLQNTRFLNVANYVLTTKEGLNEVVDFEKLAEEKPLIAIRGDIDNLGLLFAEGLRVDEKTDLLSQNEKTLIQDNKEYYSSGTINEKSQDFQNRDLFTLSRITQMSDLLKTFFSEYLNFWLKENYPKTYTIYAGGDDLFLISPFFVNNDEIKNDRNGEKDETKTFLNLIDDLNKEFEKFVCNNPEIHISWSATPFKHSTPIKFVAESSEKNQKESKKDKLDISNLKENSNFFHKSKNKASIFLFGDVIKNEEVGDFIKEANNVIVWRKNYDKNLENKPKMSSGILRDLHDLMILKKESEEKGKKKDSRKMIWHPILTYKIEREFKNRQGELKDSLQKEVFDFCNQLTDISSKNFVDNYILSLLKFVILNLRK